MSEFRVISDKKSLRKRELWTRLTLWGAAFALSCITLFAVYGADSASPQLTTALAWLAGLIVVASIVGANLVSYRQGMEKVKRDLSFELTDKDLIRRKAGWPDVRIGLAEIHALYEGQGWLVVESVKPIRKIAIPAGAEGFPALRAELAKHSSVIIARRRSLAALIPLVVSLICWALALWSKNARVAELAAAVALAILTWGSLRLVRLMSGKGKKVLVWIMVGISWATAILLIYLRVMRGW
jgi:hypothetical protein